jgi:hypothetical protein
MSEIQKYHLGWDYEEADMYPSENGDYVLYTDHLAEIAEKDEKIELYLRTNKTHLNTMLEQSKQIAALQSRIKELEDGRVDAIRKRCKELLEFIWEGEFEVETLADFAARQEARIKELEEKLLLVTPPIAYIPKAMFATPLLTPAGSGGCGGTGWRETDKTA